MSFVLVVFLIPSAVAWYLLRKEVMSHVSLMLLYGGSMVLLAYWAGGMFVLAGDSGEETVGNVFRAYRDHGGSIVLAIVGAGAGGLVGEYAFKHDS